MFRTLRLFTLKSHARPIFRGSPVYKNDEIIFDLVKVLDKRGVNLGEMSTHQGVQLAKSQGLDLHLIDFDVEPPTCVIANDSFILELSKKYDKPAVNETESYSFDPTARPATIQFTVNIAEEEFERKVDLLRRHLLDRRRCTLVVRMSESCEATPGHARAIANKILGEVNDVGKLAGSDVELDDAFKQFPVRLRIWPCDPDQTSDSLLLDARDIPVLSESASDKYDTNNKTRSRKDPWLTLSRKKVISDD